MSDDLDDLIRRAMKTLDDQVPSGYFEGLPNRTLARLEDTSMQTENDPAPSASLTGKLASSSGGIPQRDEDSGLHDIRSLASSQRMRISTRRSTQNPIIPDDDILASSSAGWKAVALPEPAKMVSLPDVAELPSKAEVKAREKAAKAAEKAAARESKKDMKAEAAAVVAAASVAPTPVQAPPPVAPPAAEIAARPAAALGSVKQAPTVDVPSMASVTPIGAGYAARTQKKSSSKVLAIAGIGLAAAAGVTLFVMTRNKSENGTKNSAAAEQTTARDEGARAPAAAVEKQAAKSQIASDTASAGAETAGVAGAGSASAGSGSAAPVVEPPPPEVKQDVAPTPKVPDKTESKPGKTVGKGKPEAAVDPSKTEKPVKKDEPTKVIKKPDGSVKETQASDDDVLNLINAEKKQQKPKLDKKELSAGDFKTGMAGVAKAAQACYAGTPGTANVKVFIAPSGQVTRVVVTGVGPKEASCIQSAVSGASFPAWDGPQASFGYTYLLSD